MGRDGEGVGSFPDGRVAFVAGALPGEIVLAGVTEERKNFVRSRVVGIVEPSPERREPPCPAFGVCGGCTLQHWDYTAELAYKSERVRDALARIAGVHPEIRPIRPSPSQYGYRNKAQFPWGSDPQGKPVLGLYRAGSHALVERDRCEIQHPMINGILAAAPAIAQDLGLTAYDETTGRGELRHLVVRVSRAEGHALVLLVASHSDARYAAFAKALMAAVDDIAGVAVNLNPERTNRILGLETLPLAGEMTMTESILGHRFLETAAAFFQVNPEAVAVLYQLVLDALSGLLDGAPRPRRVWDVYGGVGTLSVLMAGSGLVDAVTLVEQDREATDLASRNLALNQVGGVHIATGAAEEVLPKLASPHAVVVDPPRSGLRPPVIEVLQAHPVPHLVYVSCNPESLARDVAALSAYHIKECTPVDMFPRTDHVETVLVLAH